MKRKNLYLISIFMVFSILFTGCGNSDLSEIVGDNTDTVIVSVNSFSNDGVIEVDFGTSKSDALPQKVSVNLSSGNKVGIPVDWKDRIPTYNSEQVGNYKFIGFFDLSDSNYKNPENFTLDVEVKVNKPELGSNPAQIGDVVNSSFNSSDYGEVSLSLEMTEIISGVDARQIIEDSIKFYPELDEGEEYILVKYIVNLKSVENGPYSIGPADFDAVSKDGVLDKYGNFRDVLDTDSLNEGDTISGYIAYSVYILDESYVVFNRGVEGEIWFDISI